jgi:hypothetical protein
MEAAALGFLIPAMIVLTDTLFTRGISLIASRPSARQSTRLSE